MEDKGIYTKKGIKVNDKTFNIKLYINRSSIIFELESPEKKYSNSFSLNDLIRIYKSYFIDYTDINEAFKGLIELFDYDLIYTEGDNSINFKIKKNNNKEISFPLKEKKDEENQINYDSLSDEMKKIINSNELILGIDLGTTYSCASIILDDKKIIIENSLGNRTTPSYVLFLDKNKVNVGELAKLQPSYHKNIIYNSKKLIGKNINDKEVQLIKDNYSFVIKEDNYSKFLKIEVDGDYYYPEQISAMVLKKIVNDSEYYLYKLLKKKIKIKNAVITAPAYFNQKQRKAILNAANIIGLNVKRIINEPTAASLAYLYDSFMNEKKNIIVLDFGGGTFDITLLHLTQENNSSYCDIICTGGDPNFGGEKFDEKLMKKCIESIQKNNLSLNKKLPQNIRLKRACENAKIKLSSQDDTRIFLEGYLPSINIDLSITTKEFEEYCEDLFNEFEGIIQKFLTDNHVDKKEINEVIPIGGSTLIPKIRSTFTKLFPDSKINYELDPKEVVAIGAAIQGGILSKLHSLKDYKLFDITNCSLGVETVGKEMSIIIKKHSHIPIEHKKEYSNAYDNATELLIKVYEGEDENNIKNDIFLGEFKIKNLPKNKKAREIKLDVIFNIDENSLLYVKAIEKANQKNFEDNLFNLGKNNEITKKKNKLIVEDPNSLMKIIDNLKNKENSMNYVDINLYIDTIKDLIIESENKIIKLEKKKKFNEIIVEEKYIIKKFGNFIKEQLLKDKTEEYEKKLILSYVKYYFKKIVRFLKKYKDTSLKKEILEEKIIDSILETIQFFEPEIIFEIVEDFTDDKELFEKSIISLIKNLYGKFEFKTSNFKFSDIYGYEYDKKRMNNLKVEIENILTLFNKLNSSQIPADFKLNTEYLESFKLKLKIKQFIIDHRNNENNSFYFSLFGIRFYKKEKKDELNSLLQQYNNQKKYIDIGLLNELNNLSSKKNNNTTRCDLFLEVFNQKEDSEKNESFLLSIFEEFNVLESDQNYNIKFNRDLYYEWKNIYDGSNAQRKLDLLNKALIKYNASLELIKNKYNDEKLKEVYRNIIKLIDIIKDRINGRK